MTNLTLYIGNKNYSSWSFRPWFGMKMAGIAFEDVLIPFDFEHDNPQIKEQSPSGKVPLLKDGALLIPESLAILDHVARKFPDKQLWPNDPVAHSIAMSISCEMVGGFAHIRNQCPMNMRREIKTMEQGEGLARDVARIEQIWAENLSAFGGPFLFGDFSIADAMYAPVVNRMEVYQLTENAAALDYMAHMKSLPVWQEWEAAGRAEPWIVEEDEV